LNVVVTVKQVLDPNLPPSHLEVDTERRHVAAPTGIPPVMNGYDANALEEALRLREQHGGKVTAVSLGDDTCRDVLRHAIAMGADAAVLLDDAQWRDLDSAATGEVLAAAIAKIGGIDLVLCGRQASDTDAGQVLHWVAEACGMPSVAPVAKIESCADAALVVHRLMENGVQRVRVQLPALIGVSSEINEPRFPAIRGRMAAGRAHIPAWTAADLALAPPAPRVQLRQLDIALSTTRARLIEGADGAAQGAALADALRAEGRL
jgi:electron transfer flavoprotein beta subunit